MARKSHIQGGREKKKISLQLRVGLELLLNDVGVVMTWKAKWILGRRLGCERSINRDKNVLNQIEFCEVLHNFEC